MIQQASVDETETNREIPRDGDLTGIRISTGLPDRRQIVVLDLLGQQRRQITEASLAGEIGRKRGIEIHHIGSSAGEHGRQKLAFHRAPGQIGPAHWPIGMAALPDGQDIVEIRGEGLGKIQRPKRQLLATIYRPSTGRQCTCRCSQQQLAATPQARHAGILRRQSNN